MNIFTYQVAMTMRNKIIWLLQREFADNNATDYKNFLINIILTNIMHFRFGIIHCVSAWQCKCYAHMSVPFWSFLGFGMICECLLIQSCNILFWLKFQCIEWDSLSHFEIDPCMRVRTDVSDVHASAWSFKCFTLIWELRMFFKCMLLQ